ncbi:MAG: hypothetical protein PHD33_05460 [Atribacterota bacterium]|jgi:hypothetical protein|nr:hypothetical protein [Atribacterota bacterium]
MEKIKKIVLLKEYNKNYGKPPVALLGNITVVSKSWYRILKFYQIVMLKNVYTSWEQL